MALDFIDSFDQYGEQVSPTSGTVALAILQTNGWAQTSIGALNAGTEFDISTAYGRFPDSRGLRIVKTGGTGSSGGIFTIGFGNNATQFVGLAYRPVTNGFSGNGISIAKFMDGGTNQIEFYWTLANKIAITKNGTLLATSTNTLSLSQWYYLEFQVTINNVSGAAECKVNGVSWVTYSGNTRNTSNNYCNQVQLGAYSSSALAIEVWYDDVVIFNSGGAAPNAYLGDKTIRMAPANAAGDVANFTPAWASWAASTVMAVGQQILDSNGNVQRVTAITSDAKTGTPSHPTWATTGGNPTTDNHVTWGVVGSGANPGAANWMAVAEAPPDDDSSYNSSSTIGNIDRFVSAAFPATCTGIVLVYETIYSRKDDAGARSLRGSVNSGGTVADNGSDFVQNSTYAYFNPVFLVDPATTVAWTIGAVNALDWGYKVTA